MTLARVKIPFQLELFVLIILEALELLDLINLELWADPHPEFKGNVLVGKGSAVSAGSGAQSDGVGLGHPLFDVDLVAVESRTAPNYGEFAIIKVGVVDALPYAEEFHRVAVSQPVRDEKSPSLAFSISVREI